MIVRRAFISDIPAMAALERQHPFYPAWGEKGLASELDNRFAVTLIAEEGAETIGFISFRMLRPELQLNAVVSSSDSLRKGVASALLSKMLEYARKGGCLTVDLEVACDNQPAIGLYTKRGFSVNGRRPGFYNGHTDALLMRLEL